MYNQHTVKNYTYFERNCTVAQTPPYISPLMSHESIFRSAIKPTSQITRNGVPSITFCRNSYIETKQLENFCMFQITLKSIIIFVKACTEGEIHHSKTN